MSFASSTALACSVFAVGGMCRAATVEARRAALVKARGISLFNQPQVCASRSRAPHGSQPVGAPPSRRGEQGRRRLGSGSFQGPVVQGLGPRYAGSMSLSFSRPVRGPLVASTALASLSRRARPNTTLNRTRYGMPAWPRSALVHHAPRGQAAMPSRAG